MRSATHDLSISAVRADALFASVLQRSDEPSTRQVRQAIAAAICAFGSSGCAARVAQAYGQHPETAVMRMRWARTAVTGAFGGQTPKPDRADGFGVCGTTPDSRTRLPWWMSSCAREREPPPWLTSTGSGAAGPPRTSIPARSSTRSASPQPAACLSSSPCARRGEPTPAPRTPLRPMLPMARSPITRRCLSWAMDNGQEAGIWGGMTEEERRRLRRRHGALG